MVFLEQPVKVLAEGVLQLRQVNQELRVLHAHELAAKVQAHTRNEAMDMRMKAELLVPGVQHGGEAVDGGAQALVGRELFGERSGCGGEEQVVSFPGVRPEEAAAQFGRQREGDEEVRRLDELALFALNPSGVGRAAALRAGFVIAGMKGEVLPSALAIKELTAQRRGAATGDGPDGAVLLRPERRSGLKKRRR